MKLTVNGDSLNIEKPVNITELLVIAKAEQPDYVTVQKNGEFIRRDDFDATLVEDGDAIEFLYFMGGGRR